MSAAKKCDRCGDYYDGYKSDIYGQTVSIDGEEVILDLMYHRSGQGYQRFADICPRCQKKFLYWFSNERYKEVE